MNTFNSHERSVRRQTQVQDENESLGEQSTDHKTRLVQRTIREGCRKHSLIEVSLYYRK